MCPARWSSNPSTKRQRASSATSCAGVSSGKGGAIGRLNTAIFISVGGLVSVVVIGSPFQTCLQAPAVETQGIFPEHLALHAVRQAPLLDRLDGAGEDGIEVGVGRGKHDVVRPPQFQGGRQR